MSNVIEPTCGAHRDAPTAQEAHVSNYSIAAVHTEELDSKGAEELMETGSSSMYRSFGSDAEPPEHGQVRRAIRGERKMHQHWEGEMRACDKLSLDVHADSGRKARRGSRPVEVC